MNKGMSLSAFVDRLGMVEDVRSSTPSDSVYDIPGLKPAVRHVDADKLTHFDTGPAIIHADGSTEWWRHGKRHRDNSLPAVEYASGTKEYYVNNLNHRADGPAVIRSCGDTLWYFEGKLHREGAPAVTLINGTTKWYYMGNLHREDGPAIERKSPINGKAIVAWHWMGKPSTEPEVLWRARAKALKASPPRMGKELLHLHRINDMIHNPVGPARVWLDGTKEWFVNNKRHRLDGPAVVLPNGEEYYYLNDAALSKVEHSVRSKSNEAKPMEYVENNTPMRPVTQEASSVAPSPIVIVNAAERHVDEKLEEKVEDKNKVKQWSDEPDELALYNDVFAPFKNILEKGYRLIRNANEWKFDYNGYELGKQEKKIFPPAKEHFTEKFLKREKEKYDRSLFDVVMRLLFLMGVEQGRRMAYQEQTPIRNLQKTLADYRERNKSTRYQLAKANAIIKIKEENPNLTTKEVNELIAVELEKTRKDRIEEIKTEMKMDPSLTCFKSKAKKKAKLTELLALANSLDKEIFKQPDWLSLLEEANCSPSEWKAFCKKNKFHKFIG
jgi:hypothetical protein